MLCFQERVEVRVARIFNTFGPRMHMADGRVVSNFILQALQNESISVSTNKWYYSTAMSMPISYAMQKLPNVLECVRVHQVS